jgi:hypothetical protein
MHFHAFMDQGVSLPTVKDSGGGYEQFQKQ